MRQLTQEDVDRIKADQAAGKTQNTIAKEWGISRTRLIRLKKQDWKLTSSPKNKQIEKQEAKALILAAEMSLTDIAKKLNVHPMTIGRWKQQIQQDATKTTITAASPEAAQTAPDETQTATACAAPAAVLATPEPQPEPPQTATPAAEAAIPA